jgi:hypothetical protein
MAYHPVLAALVAEREIERWMLTNLLQNELVDGLRGQVGTKLACSR